MLDFLAGVPGRLKTLSDRLSTSWAAKVDTLHDTRLTAGRASALDNLDAAISTRASAASLSGLLTTVINSIQQVSIQITDTNTYGTVTITSVNAAKTVVVHCGVLCTQYYANDSSFGVYLVNSTTVRADRVGTTGAATVKVTVVEFK